MRVCFDLDCPETAITVKTCELMASLDEKEKELTEYQTTIVNIKQ
jgi:hypothetical protein